MPIEELARLVLSGLSYGMLLFLIASGLSLVLGMMGVLNLAHGSLCMIGALTGVLLVQRLDASWGLALCGAIAAAVAVGWLVERFLLRQLHGRQNEQVLLTLGLVYVFGDLALWWAGAYPLLGRPPGWLRGSVSLGPLAFPVYRLALIGLGLAVGALLWWLQERTRTGAIIRAGMDDREMLEGLGVNHARIAAAVFAFGAALAGAAGFIGAPMLGAKWDMGFTLLLAAMIVVVVGGVGRVEGTLLGACIVGLLDALGKRLFPEYAAFTVYGLFVVVLVLRPTGLLGRAVLGSAPATLPPVRESSAPIGARKAAVALVAAGIALLLVPSLAGSYLVSMLSEVLIYALLASSLNLLFGYAGLFSLGHAAFFAVGAYVAGALMVHGGFTNAWLVLPVAVLAAGGVAALAAVVALRTRGVYFVFVTLAIGELVATVALKAADWTGGSNGLAGVPLPSLGGEPLTLGGYYYVIVAVCVCAIALLRTIGRSSFGLALRGMRDDERRMQHLGYDVWRLKFVAFVIAGALAGLAGALYAPFAGTVVPSYAGSVTSTTVMLMVILGGSHPLWGPVIGAAVVVSLQYYASLYFQDRWNLVLGAVFVLTVLGTPHRARLLRHGRAAALRLGWAR